MHIRTLTLAAALLLLAVANPSRAQDAGQLAVAIVSNDQQMARAVLDSGVSVNTDLGDGRTPLITAAMFTRPDMVRLLLDRGADPERQASDGSIGNALTAAFFAMNGGTLTGRDERDAATRAAALEVLRLIAARRPNCDLLVRRGPTHLSALMMAAEAGVPEVVKILLDAGAAPNLANGGKYTALDFAVDRPPVWSQTSADDRAYVVRLLLAAGAQTQRKGADGLTPAQRARRGGNAAVVSMLTASLR